MKNLIRLKKFIEDVKFDAEDERNGSIIDLCRVLLRVIRQYQRYGIDYVIKKHW